MGIPSVVRARRWRLILAGIVVLVAGIATETAAYAFGCVWNQSMPGNWNVALNWSTCNSTTPQAADTVAIGASTGACTMVGNASVTSITLSAGSLIQGANTITTTGAFTQSGGTFTGGSATITIGTDLVLSTGTFNSTSGLLEIDGQFNQTGGTFSGGTGRVILNSSANKNFVAVTGSTTFKNLYINETVRRVLEARRNRDPIRRFVGLRSGRGLVIPHPPNLVGHCRPPPSSPTRRASA